ncbi:unnamed protein product [Symbiodinium microadriaticum]|nr:unnamed protein product [Symbiodinium microadriaticum]
MHMKRGLLFVGLPLRLYLADSPHLYELIRRMRSLADPAIAGEVSVSNVRKVLDADGCPYSVLVYGLMAGLQALHSARLTGKRGGTGAQSLDALSATARLTGEHQFEVKEIADNCPLIFRGIWVPNRIDEHTAAYTWSFNSFSRSMEGVLWVLDFYAVENTGNQSVASLAWQESHVLIYVARFNAASSTWAFPVQFFNSGMAADVEKEVVLPPFVHYDFELLHGSLYEVRSTMSTAMKTAALMGLERLWGISLAEHAPQLLQLLEGRGTSAFPGLNRNLRVTVRFIKQIELCKPLQDIMTSASGPPENLLLAFPPKDPADAQKQIVTVFGAGVPDVNQLINPGDVRPMGTFVPGQRVAEGHTFEWERSYLASPSRHLSDEFAQRSPDAESLAMLLGPACMGLGTYLSISAHNGIQRLTPFLQEDWDEPPAAPMPTVAPDPRPSAALRSAARAVDGSPPVTSQGPYSFMPLCSCKRHTDGKGATLMCISAASRTNWKMVEGRQACVPLQVPDTEKEKRLRFQTEAH